MVDAKTRAEILREIHENHPDMNTRDREREMRKEIVDSPEFQEWIRQRRTIQPFPSDPYRAYMIDKSLYAPDYDKESWNDYVNRSDFHPIDDLPGSGQEGGPIHRRHRSPTFTPSSKVRPKHEGEVQYEDLRGHASKFTKTYDLTDVDIVVEKRGGSAYSHPIYSSSGELLSKGRLLVPEKHYQAVKGDWKKKVVRKQWEAINTHELGHHAQFSNAPSKGFDFEDMDVKPTHGELARIYERVGPQPTTRIRREKFAWEVAKDYYKKEGKPWKGSTALVNRWALGTYTGYTPPVMERPNAKIAFNPERQLLESIPRNRKKR